MISYLRKYLYKNDQVPILSKFDKYKIKPPKKYKKKKVFYIIKKDRWRGIFSNVHHVLLHTIYAQKKNYTPIVDMKFFPTIYNEIKKINKSFNAWDYYFKNTKEKIDEIYKNYKYVFSDEINLDTSKIKKKDYKDYKKILRNLKFDDKIIFLCKKFKKKKFKKKRILGVHFRGSDQITAASHPFPPTSDQIIKITKEIFYKNKFNLIFLVTEDDTYLNIFKKTFGEKLIYFDSYRSNNIFKNYPRKNHRYLLGLETIVNMILLSKTDFMIHSNSNFSTMATHFSKKKIPEIIIYNGINSKNIFLSKFLWYFKSYLPYKFGGFENKIIKK